MKTIRIGTGTGYDVTVGGGILKNLGKTARAVTATKDAKKAVVVCDSNISTLYAEEAVMSLKLAGYTVTKFVIKPTELTRRLNTVTELCSAAADAGLRKGDFFVAVGGIMTCDITGIAALLYLCGSPYISVPTTTLAQVIRSVGVTQNIDLPEDRRMIAARWQPAAVLCDTDLLSTQPKRSLNNGIAEIIKLGCIASDKLIDEIDSPDKEKLITHAINIREKLVTKDERTSGTRPIIHFGNLLCRALEEVSDYSLDHSEALSIGMTITCAAAEGAGLALVGTTDKLEALLKKYGLPTSTNIPHEKLLEAISADRYAKGASFALPLIRSIGDGYVHKLNTSELRSFFIRSLPDWAQ